MRRKLAIVVAVALVAGGVWVGWRTRELGHDGATFVLDGGVRVQARARDCDSEFAIPRDPLAFLVLARSPSWRRSDDDFCQLSAVDRWGEFQRSVRAAAREKAGSGRRVLVVGWDGADPRVVDDLLRARHLPNLSSLRERGAWGAMRSHAPYLSPLLWTSMATGQEPAEHGILDFVESGPGGTVQPIGGSCLRSTPVWRIASDLGRRSLVVNWWATWPEMAVDGEVVSDRWVRDAAVVEPTREPLRVSAASGEVGEVVSRILPLGGDGDPRAELLRGFVAEALTTERVVLEHLRGGQQPALTMAYFQLIDQAGHLFVEEMPPRQAIVSEDHYRRFGGVVHGTYLVLDHLLGQLLAMVEPDTAVMLVSDHGFVYGLERRRLGDGDDPLSDRLHAPEGIYAFAGPFETGPGPTLDIYDVFPTILAALELPVPTDVPGRVPASFVGPVQHVATHEVRLDPPAFGLLDGSACGGDLGPGGVATSEAVEKLVALGYVGGDGVGGEGPVLPLANLARSLLERGEPDVARVVVEQALARRRTPWLVELHLEATLASRTLPLQSVIGVARQSLVDAQGKVQPGVGFALIQLLLREGLEPEAVELTKRLIGEDVVSALGRFLVAAWIDDREAAGNAFRSAVVADPLRAIDTCQGLLETFPNRELGIDRLLAEVADSLPIGAFERSPASALTGNSEPARKRASAGSQPPSVVDRLWRRRLRAYGS